MIIGKIMVAAFAPSIVMVPILFFVRKFGVSDETLETGNEGREEEGKIELDAFRLMQEEIMKLKQNDDSREQKINFLLREASNADS